MYLQSTPYFVLQSPQSMKTFPGEFLLHAKKFAGEEYEDFIASLSTPAPVSIRHNPFKKAEVFSDEKIIPWSSEGRYLEVRPSFTFDPLFHAGCYYVQDASSQFLEQPFLLAKKSLNRPLKVLDLCAAPGGKSTHVLSLLDETDLLVSNEIVAGRNSILRQNIIKWGNSNVVVTQNNPSDYERLEGFFDIVIVDAPCSGEGLFRKDENAIDEWSEENVVRCNVRQQEILNSAYAALSPGGFLIYSTCTFEEVENDNQVEYLCEKFEMKSVPIENNFDGIVHTKFGLIFFPHRIRGEGFYISLLRKKDGNITSVKKTGDNNDSPYKKYLNRFINNADNFFPLLKDERLFSIPSIHLNNLNIINRNLYIRLAGIYSGEFKGEDFVPSAALALSNHLKPDLPVRELNYDESISYLRGELLKSEGNKGWILVSHRHFNLGWIKNLGQRINNYYPKEWRIKKN